MCNSRIHYSLISFLLVFVLSLGASFAGSLQCTPDCPECAAVSTCCAGGDDATGSANGSSAYHLPDLGNSSHKGLCFDKFQAPAVTAACSIIHYHSSILLSLQQDCQGYQASSCRPIFTDPRILSPAKSPALFLLNCSFLI